MAIVVVPLAWSAQLGDNWSGHDLISGDFVYASTAAYYLMLAGRGATIQLNCFNVFEDFGVFAFWSEIKPHFWFWAKMRG